ncbi:hypothetical protein I6M33_16530 [Shewanella algae]|uniref:hypothetical protein n=1 Tax=Shewanella algae TaxID=38313 RepID=UPI001AAD5732|nr:hypothetical protein [Shewanella algae]MBO2557938.1 hypothetical protein [Shewanella algae]MBO2562189.1 hypothetical protein [Shewanella algae]MBO2574874.1 hypothetical protein [Shewanella algae]MBO2617335.1 hypothetical protein [Shewanella algae]
MATDEKQLSNPFSTGSGGARFEANIQATFVTLMLSGGYAPCLPSWPIVEIKLQGSVAGYGTDDLIVFVENPVNNDRRRLLGQVKNSIAITAKSKLFAEVIQAAWNDFNNPDVFTKGKDVIALITGPINATDTDGVNGLLEQARHTRDADEFLTQVGRAHFCSDNVRSKLTAFKTQLKVANKGCDVEKQDFYEFLKHFHLLGYDLAKKGSVISSLLNSHIAQFNKDIPDKIWYQIVNEVQDFNQYAGTITLDTLPGDLVEHFREPVIAHIPKELAKEEVKGGSDVQPVATDWNQCASAQKLAVANLIGSWKESNEADIAIVTQIVGEDYNKWIVELRETLQVHDCPLSYKNGLWSFKDRLKSWQELGGRLFDDHLDTFKAVALEVLRIEDPSFELPSEERYAAAIHGKVLPHSGNLRKGLAETLALIGSRATSLINCTQGKADAIAALSVRELFDESDWVRWGSLNSLLPTLSEASPDEFLSAVENAIDSTPSPFDRLFEQEDTGVFGRNYITGLLWALEGIAWEETYLSRTAVVLAEIASHDPGGNWANRPGNSLTDIFLPWLPHTLASIEKRQAALKTICAEQPEVGWKLLESLLPNQHSTTSGTHKPSWRETVPDEWEKGVTNNEYWEQSRFCAVLIVEQAGFDIVKLASLAGNYDHLPPPASEMLRDRLASDHCLKLSEEERLPIWGALCKLIAHHRRFPDAKWSLGDDSLLPIEAIASQLAPQSPSLLNKRLFSDADAYLYEGDGDWQEEQEKLFQIRKAAIGDILDEGGLPQVLEFARTVTNAHLVGAVLADMDQPEFDVELLPVLLDMADQKLWSFVAAYAWRRRFMGNWQWFDDINKAGWEPKQIALLLCALPFERNAWDRAAQLLGENENEYWKNTSANTYQTEDDTEYALGKLLEFGRPNAAIEGLMRDLHRKKDINPELACDALLALVQTEEPTGRIDSYHITKIIKALQENDDTDQDKLFHVEWAYVSLLDRHSDGSPVTLENRLASDPGFFSELIQLIYRAEGAEPKEPSEQHRNIATNAYRLLSTWKVVPGTRADGEFEAGAFTEWLTSMEEIVKASGHYDVAMIQLGDVLVNSPQGPDGLWIHPVIAEAMNNRERSSLRDGYRTGIFNSRGVHTVDPEAKPERALAEKYRQRADQVENAGYQRLATTLRSVADSYDRDAERIISRGGVPH